MLSLRTFLTVGLPAAAAFAMGGSVEIIGHRGASHDAPENTLAAFRLCWQQKADAGELDIYLTRDRHVVVFHDADTKRITGVEGKIAGQTMAELRTRDAGAWKDPAFAGEKIPLLAEALATIPDGRRMFIEIKCGEEVLEPLEKCLAQSGRKPEQLALIGFGYRTMVAAKKRLPRHACYWVVSHVADAKTGRLNDIDELITKAVAGGLDGLDLEEKFPIDAAMVAKVRAAGLKLFVWTVNDPAVAKKFASAGVDGITTDRPGWLREQLR